VALFVDEAIRFCRARDKKLSWAQKMGCWDNLYYYLKKHGAGEHIAVCLVVEEDLLSNLTIRRLLI
jgi:hypothetical protein